MTTLFHLPGAPPLDLWEEHRLQEQADNDANVSLRDIAGQRRMPFSSILPDRDAPVSVPSSPQSTYNRASSTAHTSRSPPRVGRRDVRNPLLSFTSARTAVTETPPPPAMLFVDPWQDEAQHSYPESVQSGDYVEKAPHVLSIAKRPKPPQTQVSFGLSSGSTSSNSITKAALAAHKASARENTASWLSRQAPPEGPEHLAPASAAAAALHAGRGHRAVVSDDDVSTVVEVKRRSTNRHSVRVSRGVPRGIAASGQEQGRDDTGFDTLTLHGTHMPWSMQCTNDDDDEDDDDEDGVRAHQTSRKGPVSARASSEISMSRILQLDDSSDGVVLDQVGPMRTTQDDPSDVIEAEGHPLSFVVLHDGQEGQFWVTEHYLNQLTIADLARLCLRATTSAAGDAPTTTPTEGDVQLHVVLSRQMSVKLGLSMQGAGMNLVPVEAWSFSMFPTMQFLLLKAFFSDLADREGLVRLLCTGRNQALPSELTASQRFWHGWNAPPSSLGHREKETQTERFKSMTARGVQTARSVLGQDGGAPSSTTFLRSVRGLSEMSSMSSSVERALDSAQESVNASFAERRAMGSDKPLPPRPLSAPVEHRRAKVLTRPKGGLASRFSEESGRESLDEEPSAILARWKRWNGGGGGQRNSGGHFSSTTNEPTAASRRPGADDGDATSVHSQTSTSSIARKITLQRKKLAHMASHTVVRFRTQRPAHKRGGSRTSLGKRRRAHTIDTVVPSPVALAVAAPAQSLVDSALATAAPQKPNGRLNQFMAKPPKSMRRKAPPPAPLDLSRLPQSRATAQAQYSGGPAPPDSQRRPADHSMVDGPTTDTDATPSTASAVLSRELCARLLQQRAQDDESEAAAAAAAAPSDFLRAVEDGTASAHLPDDTIARHARQSNTVEELDELVHGAAGQHDESDAHSIVSSSASFAGSTFAGIRRLFQASSNSSVTSLALATPPASPAGTFKTTLSKQVSLVVKSSLTSFRKKDRLGSRPHAVQTSQIGEPVLLTEIAAMTAVPISVTNVAAEMEPVIITHSPDRRAVSHHASVLSHSPSSSSSSSSSSSYDSSVEAAARRPGKPLLLTTSSAKRDGRLRPAPAPVRGAIASLTSTDTYPHRRKESSGGDRGKSPELSPIDRRQSSTETALATWQAYTTAEAARSTAIASDYGASALLSAHFGSTPGAHTGTSCDTGASPLTTTTPLTPPSSRGWRRCDENMEPAMRDCVASLRGFKMGSSDDDDEEDTMDESRQQQQQQRQATASPELRWINRRPSMSRSLDMLSRSDSVSSASPSLATVHHTTRTTTAKQRPVMIITAPSQPRMHLHDASAGGGIGEQPHQLLLSRHEQVSGASAAAAANSASSKNGPLSRANSFLGRHLPLRRPTTANPTVSLMY